MKTLWKKEKVLVTTMFFKGFSPKGVKSCNCVVKDKLPGEYCFNKQLLVRSNFSFSHDVFKSCLLLMHQNEYLWSKGLTKKGIFSHVLEDFFLCTMFYICSPNSFSHRGLTNNSRQKPYSIRSHCQSICPILYMQLFSLFAKDFFQISCMHHTLRHLR